MKPTSNAKSKNPLVLKKSTVAHLAGHQAIAVNGGANEVTTKDGGIPETCGYACTDCMSTMNTMYPSRACTNNTY